MVAHGARGRARSSGGGPRGTSSDCGRARRALEAHRAGGGQRQARLGGAVERRRLPASAGASIVGVEVVDLELARRRRRGRGRAGPGARSAWATARGERTVKRGPPARCAGSSRAVPEARRVNGRSGSASRERARAAGRSARGPTLRRSRPAASCCWRLGSMRTTSHARPTLLQPADDERSRGRSPTSASRAPRRSGRRGGCCATPRRRTSSDSHARLRDSSSVSKRRRPKKWHSELIE